MHEFHAVEDIFKQALQKARDNNAVKVTKLTLAMGELLGFDEGSVRLYFEELSHGTLLQDAELVFHSLKAKLQCKDCSASFEKDKSNLACPTCCSASVILKSGREFYIENIEIETKAN